MEGIYKKVCIEITDGCNAKCKWCTTGIKNRITKTQFSFMPLSVFQMAMERLERECLIDTTTSVELYNWGEPLLNPQLSDILDFIISKGYMFHLSTNGSKYVEFSREQIEAMEYFTFSLSGMTEESYEKIHGLNLRTVLENIRKTAERFRQFGFNHKIILHFHVYQFNLDEISAARDFAEELGISFVPSYAYFNDYELFDRYLNHVFETVSDALETKDIFTFFYDELRKKQPENYQCPAWEELTIDTQLNLLPCPRLTTQMDNCGNLMEISSNEIRTYRSAICDPCIRCGQAFITHSQMLTPKWCEELSAGKRILEKNAALEANLAEYDENLKQALKKNAALEANLTEYDENLRLALEKNAVLEANLTEYDENLKLALKKNVVLEANLADYDENLKQALKKNAALEADVVAHDENLKIALDKVKKLEEEEAAFQRAKESFWYKHFYKESRREDESVL